MGKEPTSNADTYRNLKHANLIYFPSKGKLDLTEMGKLYVTTWLSTDKSPTPPKVNLEQRLALLKPYLDEKENVKNNVGVVYSNRNIPTDDMPAIINAFWADLHKKYNIFETDKFFIS